MNTSTETIIHFSKHKMKDKISTNISWYIEQLEVIENQLREASYQLPGIENRAKSLELYGLSTSIGRTLTYYKTSAAEREIFNPNLKSSPRNRKPEIKEYFYCPICGHTGLWANGNFTQYACFACGARYY